MSSWEVALGVVDALAAHGSDVVLCPGSRNAPLAVALATTCGLRVHVRLDERSAAFTALGMARVTGRAVPVVMTSGTAVANCLPAMIEAHHAGVPLAIVSADRPTRLVGTGASQTITHTGLFSTVTPTVTVSEAATRRQTAATVRRALAEHPQAHINVAFDTPLLPAETVSPRRVSAVQPPLEAPRTDWGVAPVDLSQRVLVIAGDGAWEVPGLEDVPTLAEPTAPAPYHPVHPLAAPELLSGVEATNPEHIIVVGHPTLHRDVLRLMSSSAIPVTVLSRSSSYTDPAGVASRVASRVRTTGDVNRGWVRLCEHASERAAGVVRSVLSADTRLTGLHVAAAVADSLGVGDTLMAGASNPVRDLSMVGLPFDGVRVVSPRGAAGIDGTVSQAVGVALATQTRAADVPRAPRVVALIGDVTFLHDVGGLLVVDGSPRPENLTIVVANDLGGGIFETLEQGAKYHRSYFDTAFGTPHTTDLASLCAGYWVPHRLVDTLTDLHVALDAVAEVGARNGCEVIEVATTRATRRALHRSLRSGVEVP